ncbi:hypothetical protein [Frigoribacterium sp. CFBP9030]|uniref:hypothetical protein n=1 Tax=Frigoribacterium sp. CFBP9030 TaxID=3096537 RepID=UPI002A6A477E|nr:hypothetical protein [Frigoribacterium sp. CFBP9030]MDY0891880.1 hypothetical protein [Frigoribacterium sp. CFBP9030]
MGAKVEVVVDGRTFTVDEATQKRWPDDYPLAKTKAGKPTAAAKRAQPNTPELPPTAADTTLTADDLLAAGTTDAGPGDDTTKER